VSRRAEDGGYWSTDGKVSYHIDRRKIKLAKVWGTGQVEFRPILARLLAETPEPIMNRVGLRPGLAAIEMKENP
jgi:hypothetical protein